MTGVEQSEEGYDAYEQLHEAKLHERGPREKIAAALVYALLDVAAAIRELARRDPS